MSFATSRRASTVSCRQSSKASPISRSSNRRVVSVRAETPGSSPNDVKPPATPVTASTPMPAAPPPPPPAPVAPATPSLQTAMGFSGAGPETINGRLAMLGFVAAVGRELASGSTLLSQLDSTVVPVVITFAIFSAASLYTIVNGGKAQPSDFWKPEAEMLNGRAAMLGLVAMAVTEIATGSAVFTI